MSKEKVLVTGGAGFIGSHLVRSLLTKGYAVRVLDSLSSQIHGAVPRDLDWLVNREIEFVRGSVESRSDWLLALEGIDYVVHLAAETGTGQSMYEVERYCATNCLGTALLIDGLRAMPKQTVKRVILASSRSVYGEGTYRCQPCRSGRVNPPARAVERLRSQQWEPQCLECGGDLVAMPTMESDPVQPASIYAATKYAQEDLVRIGCGSMGLGYVIFRFQNVYGEGQSLHNPYTGILSIFSTRIRRGLELPIFEDGLESRDFVHVDDVVEAVTGGLASELSANEVFNVGSGSATSVKQLAEELSRAFGREPRLVVTGQFRIGDIRHNVADMTKIRARFAFAPSISLKAGLRRFTAWVESQPLPEDRLDQANQELKERKLMG
ncbi:MAG TPA: NAD-dependent epimerase/dehydratase family protein [Candidatus Angelobacter sp.]|jgi:dTDP-L-rhamnose 4-epimerase|nr:NAD-dependent epimerase/dehydratase family protein [Candidatus Angelobacter sp.]